MRSVWPRMALAGIVTFATPAAARVPFAFRSGAFDAFRSVSARRETALPPVAATPQPSGIDAWLASDRATGDWAGARTWLGDHGLNLEASWFMDSSRGFLHAPTQRWATRSLADVNVALDLEKSIGWSGASIFADAYGLWGHEAAVDLGDFQSTSALDAGDDFFELAELWFEQRLFDDAVRIKIGKVDANSEFGFTDIAGEFVHASGAWSPTFFQMPTYPDPATAAIVFVYPTEHLYAGVGVFDGAAAAGARTGLRGPETFFDGDDGFYVISEMGLMWDGAGAGLGTGRLAVAPWVHTGNFARFDGRRVVDDTSGVWVNLEQQLWRENPSDSEDEQGISAYLRTGYADGDVSDVTNDIGAGLVWRGPLPGRDEDSSGLMVSWARLSKSRDAGYDGNETAYELYYRFRLSGFLSLLTDFQYIAQPSGTKGKSDVLVSGLRVELNF